MLKHFLHTHLDAVNVKNEADEHDVEREATAFVLNDDATSRSTFETFRSVVRYVAAAASSNRFCLAMQLSIALSAEIHSAVVRCYAVLRLERNSTWNPFFFSVTCSCSYSCHFSR